MTARASVPSLMRRQSGGGEEEKGDSVEKAIALEENQITAVRTGSKCSE